jgi:hypothetical protein
MFIVQPSLRARLSQTWSDEEIFAKADLVVIATVVSTKETKERSTLPDMKPPVKVSGVETEFETRLVLKGKKNITKFGVHYYEAHEEFTNGPELIEIPKGEHPTYLLFLTKDNDGRYAPATNQTDPATTAVFRLRGANGVRGYGPEPQLRNERAGQQWTYQQMLEKADLVVKAAWVSTKNTDERSVLPDTDIPSIGITSEFEINFVLKGPKDVKKLELHHYKFQDDDDTFRYVAPQLIRIIPPVTRGEREYSGGGEFVLFVKKESDGRYAPVTGQTDPALSSVLELVPALY